MTNKQPKILLLDIETSPNLGWIWGKYEQDVIKFKREWFILCFSAKWLDTPKIITKCLPDYRLYKKDAYDDKELIKDLWLLLNEADIVVAHNGDKFDIKKINSRIVFHGMQPPAPFQSVDTLKIARRYFGFTSNKLADLVKSLSIGKEKINTGGFDLWIRCLAGNLTAWKEMSLYNKRDVELLEAVYYRLKPWDISHPNHSVYSATQVCSRCGSDKLQSRGSYVSKTLTYRRFWCVKCGGWMRSYNREESDNKPLISV